MTDIDKYKNTFNIQTCISDLTDRGKDVLLFLHCWMTVLAIQIQTYLSTFFTFLFLQPEKRALFCTYTQSLSQCTLYYMSPLRISSQGFRLWKYNSAIKRFYERHYAMLKSCDILSQVPPERKDNNKNSAEMLHFCSIYSKGLLATYLLDLKANI